MWVGPRGFATDVEERHTENPKIVTNIVYIFNLVEKKTLVHPIQPTYKKTNTHK